ncbi:MAG: hypothetical protein QOD28_1244 [Acidobacteriota bacterium]|nr:hypothetical protein [Acidobacteriota bacterium]
MKIEYISQPFLPEEQWLGKQLQALLTGEQGHFDRFLALIAFVKFSGVSRVYSALETFRDAGGTSTITAGINHKGTSIQGLQFLREVVDHVFIYYDNSPERRTFHPKIYIFEETNKRGIVILGSGNFTAGGLFTNYEAHIRVEVNLSDEPQYNEDREFFNEVKTKCMAYQDMTSECIQELTDEVLAKLTPILLDELASESVDEPTNVPEDEAIEPDRAESAPSPFIVASELFGRSQFPRAPRPDISLNRHRPAKTAPPASGTTPTGAALPSSAVPSSTVASPSIKGFWKVLSPNDVSLTSSPGQIIIPIKFRSFFEPLPLTKQPDAGGKGRRWDDLLDVQFTDGAYVLIVTARCIIYEPETGHPRPNTECRFTFRSKDILARLNAGDILLFTHSTSANLRFEVEKIPPTDPRYIALHNSNAKGHGLLT